MLIITFNLIEKTTIKIQGKSLTFKANLRNIDVQILYESADEEAVLVKETELIKYYGRQNIDKNGILLNLAEGGNQPPKQTGKPRSAETKQKISETRKSKGIYPTAGIEASRIANTGRVPPNKGCKTNPVAIAKRQKTRALIKSLFDEERYDELLSLDLKPHVRKRLISRLRRVGIPL